jgi:hypothetical protein
VLATRKQAGQNVEMPNFTQAYYGVEELQAEGIVGVQLQERSHGWGSHVIEFFAVGTGDRAERGARTLPDDSHGQSQRLIAWRLPRRPRHQVTRCASVRFDVMRLVATNSRSTSSRRRADASAFG